MIATPKLAGVSLQHTAGHTKMAAATEVAQATTTTTTPPQNSSLYVGDLDREATEASLYELFSQVRGVTPLVGPWTSARARQALTAQADYTC